MGFIVLATKFMELIIKHFNLIKLARLINFRENPIIFKRDPSFTFIRIHFTKENFEVRHQRYFLIRNIE